MSDDKKPILLDLDWGLVATFEEEEWNNNRETDYVRVIYFPFNSLPIFSFKKCEYPAAISRTHIFPIHVPVKTGLVGQPKQLYIIYRGEKTGIMSTIINDKLQDQIAKLTNQLSDAQKEISKLRQENQDKTISVGKSVQQARSIADKSNPLSDTGVGVPGFNSNTPPFFGGFQR